jgi:hypothetical protein
MDRFHWCTFAQHNMFQRRSMKHNVNAFKQWHKAVHVSNIGKLDRDGWVVGPSAIEVEDLGFAVINAHKVCRSTIAHGSKVLQKS